MNFLSGVRCQTDSLTYPHRVPGWELRLNAGLSDGYVGANILWERAECIAFQTPMLYSLSPPGTLTSSCQPLNFSVLSPSSFSYLHLHLSLSSDHRFFIARSVPSILLPARPSAPLLFDVSLIPSRLSAALISSILQRYPGSLTPHLSHFPCPPFRPSLPILFCLPVSVRSPPTSFTIFLLSTSLFRICNLSNFPAPSIIHISAAP